MLQTLAQFVKNVGQRVQELRCAGMMNAKEKALDFSAASFAAHDETLRYLRAQDEYIFNLENRICELESRLGIRHG